MPTHDLTTVTVPIDTLRPHPSNPRNGDTDAIAESIEVNGIYRPIVVTKDGTILAGNHTYAAALELGYEELAVVRLDIDPDSPEALRIMLVDNRSADLGGYDDSLLLTLLETLRDTAGTGYIEQDVTSLAALLRHTPTDYEKEERDLADEVERATWPTITIKQVPPAVHTIWESLDGDPVTRLTHLLHVD